MDFYTTIREALLHLKQWDVINVSSPDDSGWNGGCEEAQRHESKSCACYTFSPPKTTSDAAWAHGELDRALEALDGLESLEPLRFTPLEGPTAESLMELFFGTMVK